MEIDISAGGDHNGAAEGKDGGDNDETARRLFEADGGNHVADYLGGSDYGTCCHLDLALVHVVVDSLVGFRGRNDATSLCLCVLNIPESHREMLALVEEDRLVDPCHRGGVLLVQNRGNHMHHPALVEGDDPCHHCVLERGRSTNMHHPALVEDRLDLCHPADESVLVEQDYGMNRNCRKVESGWMRATWPSVVLVAGTLSRFLWIDELV